MIPIDQIDEENENADEDSSSSESQSFEGFEADDEYRNGNHTNRNRDEGNDFLLQPDIAGRKDRSPVSSDPSVIPKLKITGWEERKGFKQFKIEKTEPSSFNSSMYREKLSNLSLIHI